MRIFKRLQEQAYDHIKEMILNGEFTNDIVYSETKLAENIGLSRTPVRDALQRLNQEGFIDIMPSKGFRIHKLSQQDVINTYEIRSAIEGYNAFMLTRERNTLRGRNVINRMEILLNRQIELNNAGSSIEDFVIADQEFHKTMVSFVENPWLIETFSNLMYSIKVMAIDSLRYPGRINQTIEEHKLVLDTIKNGNYKDVYEVVNKHMEMLKMIIFKQMESTLVQIKV